MFNNKNITHGNGSHGNVKITQEGSTLKIISKHFSQICRSKWTSSYYC
jgi:hypothetical protein